MRADAMAERAEEPRIPRRKLSARTHDSMLKRARAKLPRTKLRIVAYICRLLLPTPDFPALRHRQVAVSEGLFLRSKLHEQKCVSLCYSPDQRTIPCRMDSSTEGLASCATFLAELVKEWKSRQGDHLKEKAGGISHPHALPMCPVVRRSRREGQQMAARRRLLAGIRGRAAIPRGFCRTSRRAPQSC